VEGSGLWPACKDLVSNLWASGSTMYLRLRSSKHLQMPLSE